MSCAGMTQRSGANKLPPPLPLLPSAGTAVMTKELQSLLAVDACVDACAASADNRDVAAAVYAGDIRIAGDPVDSTV